MNFLQVELVSDYPPPPRADPPRPRSKSFGAQPTSTAGLRPSTLGINGSNGEGGVGSGRGQRRFRRFRHHSGGRGLEGNAKCLAEKERYRRHSENSPRGAGPAPPSLAGNPHPPDSFAGKAFHRRSSPAILEPLLQGEEFRIPLELSEEDEEEHPPVFGLGHTDQSSSSSSADENSRSSSRENHAPRDPKRKHRPAKHRRKRLSKVGHHH